MNGLLTICFRKSLKYLPFVGEENTSGNADTIYFPAKKKKKKGKEI